ncbi:unnamed protein product [Oncorhynchus mykiss]|uniref:Uncharacterized protein n=1 Tax=Oncorhynchus mykiss TaxID=8022 RepID=A0A060YXY0_ONCMY|nr:unnamed protein product [Oncorhynchus mykiss]
MDAKDSEMSDTLSPSQNRSSDDTSDELRMANLEPGDREQVIHHLHRELLEAQELANTGKQKCLELQALLEEERRSNRQQTKESAKQIQYLQSEYSTDQYLQTEESAKQIQYLQREDGTDRYLQREDGTDRSLQREDGTDRSLQREDGTDRYLQWELTRANLGAAG